ncbi:rod shape-determining protein [Aerococcaceae bacterium DSM 111022]|nr:rod shape-determining protein [Aerococcaceae bacterium DSM 111022]
MSREIGIDLGTANVLIHLKGRGIVVNEPAVVAVDLNTNEIVAYGQEAYDMIGRTPETINVIHPLEGGVISDYDLAEAMLILFMRRIQNNSLFSRPVILICAPSQINDIEKQSLIETAERASGGIVYVEEETKVAALGAGGNIMAPQGTMVIDIGGGTSDIAVISQGEITNSKSLRMAGDYFNDAIIEFVKEKYHLLIGDKTAEQVKIAISSAILLPEDDLSYYDVNGLDLVTRLPKAVKLNSNDMAMALAEPLEAIAQAVESVLKNVRPELLADIVESGILLTGGGALIDQLDEYLSGRLEISVIKVDQPMNSVAIGTGLMLELIQSGEFEKSKPTRWQLFKRQLQQFKRRLMG